MKTKNILLGEILIRGLNPPILFIPSIQFFKRGRVKREKNPIEISLAFAEEICSLWKLLMVAIQGALVTFIALIIWSDVSFIFHPSIWIDFAVITPIAIIALFYVRGLWRLGKRAVKWEKNFMKFSYIFKFETHPPKGKTPQEKILNHLSGVIRELELDRLSSTQRKIETFLNVGISGKKDEHLFDVYVSEELLKDDKSEVAQESRSRLRKYGSVFVKRYCRKKPVDESDLDELKREIQDVIGKTKSRINTITVVSTSGFTNSANAYAKDKENWIKKRAFNLIQEAPDGYMVVQIG